MCLGIRIGPCLVRKLHGLNGDRCNVFHIYTYLSLLHLIPSRSWLDKYKTSKLWWVDKDAIRSLNED